MDDAANPIEAIFAEALRLADPERRGAYLASACGEDVRLRRRVEAVLAAHDAAGSFMAAPADPSAVATLDGIPVVNRDLLAKGYSRRAAEDGPLAEQPGTIIGHYKLLQRIGEGGFGTVWMADQERPVRRRVALKIIKLGMDTK